MKEYYVSVHVRFDNLLEAESKEDAIKKVKESFKQEMNIELQDEEIVEVEEVK